MTLGDQPGRVSVLLQGLCVLLQCSSFFTLLFLLLQHKTCHSPKQPSVSGVPCSSFALTTLASDSSSWGTTPLYLEPPNAAPLAVELP